MEHKIQIAHDPTGSRIYDALLESPTVPPKSKRQFIMDFIGHYHELVDDRIGSRVGDRCWASSDTYLKEKVARSLIPYESQLAGSFFGKFFARNLNLYLLQRRPDDWRNMQTQRKQQQQQVVATPKKQDTGSSAASQAPVQESAKDGGKKRSKPSDEIEELFEKTLGKKIKKAALGTEVEKPKGLEEEAGEKGKKRKKKDSKDRGGELDSVLGAIKSAPKHEDGGRPKKKHKRA